MSDPRTRVTEAARRLAAAGIDSPRLDARLLWDHALRVASAGGQEAGGEQAAASLFEGFIARRLEREPFAYITGHKEFWSLDFEVGPGALIPRPETETVIEQALAAFPDRAVALDVADLGVGTGCLLLAFLKEFQNARGLGLDISEKALDWAIRNANRLGLAGRCRFEAGNWNENIFGPCDVILTNPPYIRSEDIAALAPDVRRYEPVTALDGGPDGLAAYRALGPILAAWLKPGGKAFLEIGAGQAEETGALMVASGLAVSAVARDLAAIPRVLVVNRPR